MSLSIAVERLQEAGWVAGSGVPVHRLEDGRAYPVMSDVSREFASAGLTLTIRYVALFDCHRAEWTTVDGAVEGYCVGRTEAEAGVYALAQLMAARQVVA